MNQLEVWRKVDDKTLRRKMKVRKPHDDNCENEADKEFDDNDAGKIGFLSRI